MKKLLLFALAAVSITACKSPEQKMVEACLLPHLKCPSTLQVVEFTSRMIPADTTIDTTYYLLSVNGSRERWESVYHTRVKEVVSDSMRITTTIYPAHKHCSITFDSQNLMGAMVRSSESVAIYQGEAMIFSRWFEKCRYNSQVLTTYHREKFVNPKFGWFDSYIIAGDWVTIE